MGLQELMIGRQPTESSKLLDNIKTLNTTLIFVSSASPYSSPEQMMPTLEFARNASNWRHKDLSQNLIVNEDDSGLLSIKNEIIKRRLQVQTLDFQMKSRSNSEQ